MSFFTILFIIGCAFEIVAGSVILALIIGAMAA